MTWKGTIGKQGSIVLHMTCYFSLSKKLIFSKKLFLSDSLRRLGCLTFHSNRATFKRGSGDWRRACKDPGCCKQASGLISTFDAFGPCVGNTHMQIDQRSRCPSALLYRRKPNHNTPFWLKQSGSCSSKIFCVYIWQLWRVDSCADWTCNSGLENPKMTELCNLYPLFLGWWFQICME